MSAKRVNSEKTNLYALLIDIDCYLPNCCTHTDKLHFLITHMGYTLLLSSCTYGGCN